MLTRDLMEARRLAAAQALKNGITQAEVARQYGVSRTTTTRWARAVQSGKSLARTKGTGRPPRVHRTVLATLVREQEHWTGIEFAQRIEQRLGYTYDPDSAGRIGKKLAPERFGPRKAQAAGGA